MERRLSSREGRTTHRLSIAAHRAALKRWGINLPPFPPGFPVPGSSGRTCLKVVGRTSRGAQLLPTMVASSAQEKKVLFQLPSLSLLPPLFFLLGKTFLLYCHCSLSGHFSFFFD